MQSLGERCRLGWQLSILTSLYNGIAWGLPGLLLRFIGESPDVPEGIRLVLVCVGFVLCFLFCPLVCEWLFRITGMVPPDNTSAQDAKTANRLRESE